MAYEIIKINDNTWRIEDNQHVRFFLLAGTNEALLIDSGMDVHNAKEIAEELTDLPIKLLIGIIPEATVNLTHFICILLRHIIITILRNQTGILLR